MLLDERLVLFPWAIAGEDDVEPGSLGTDDRAQHGEERLADRAGRREEEEERAPPIGTDSPHVARRPRQVFRVDDRAHLADGRSSPHHERARGRHPLVEHPDLAHERHHHAGEQDHGHPQDDVRYEERLRHAPPRSRARAGASASMRSSEA